MFLCSAIQNDKAICLMKRSLKKRGIASKCAALHKLGILTKNPKILDLVGKRKLVLRSFIAQVLAPAILKNEIIMYIVEIYCCRLLLL